jgi:carbohydrate-selective porin OprB
LQWHENITYPREGQKVNVSEADQARCATIFQKFGVKADFKNVTNESIHVRNALWLARFFARRDADGSEKFVRQIQNLMVDYTK